MRFPWRATFLIVALVPTLNVSWVYVAFILVGYNVFNFVEHLQKQTALDSEFEYEFLDWEVDQEDPGWENKGNLSREKMSPDNQIVVARTTDLLRRML